MHIRIELASSRGTIWDSNLVPENSDGASRRDLVGREPGGGQLRRHPQDEDLGDGDDRLTEEQERELGLAGGQHLDPTAQTGSEGPDEDTKSQTLQEKKPDFLTR